MKLVICLNSVYLILMLLKFQIAMKGCVLYDGTANSNRNKKKQIGNELFDMRLFDSSSGSRLIVR